MRLPLFLLGMVLTLSLIATGCGGGNNTEPHFAKDNTSQANAPTPITMNVISEGKTSHPSEETVKKFLATLLAGNTQETVALLTPLAQAEFAKNTFYLNSLSSFQSNEFQEVEFRIIGSDLVSENDPNYFGVHVNAIMNSNIDEPTPTIWLVRKIGNEYRVAGMMFYDDEIQQYAAFDFEGQVNPDGVTPAQQQTSTNQTPLANNQQMTQQNPQVSQPTAQQPQFNAPGIQQPNPNSQQTAQPNTPIFQ